MTILSASQPPRLLDWTGGRSIKAPDIKGNIQVLMTKKDNILSKDHGYPGGIIVKCFIKVEEIS